MLRCLLVHLVRRRIDECFPSLSRKSVLIELLHDAQVIPISRNSYSNSIARQQDAPTLPGDFKRSSASPPPLPSFPFSHSYVPLSKLVLYLLPNSFLLSYTPILHRLSPFSSFSFRRPPRSELFSNQNLFVFFSSFPPLLFLVVTNTSQYTHASFVFPPSNFYSFFSLSSLVVFLS